MVALLRLESTEVEDLRTRKEYDDKALTGVESETVRGGISKGELYQKKSSKRYCKPKTTRTDSRRNYQGWFKKKLTARGPRKFSTESSS